MPRHLTLILAATLAFFFPSIPTVACDQHLDRANHYRDLRRAGGSARQMARWQQQRNQHQKRYQDCRLGDRSTGSIYTARGAKPQLEKPDYQKPRRTQVRDDGVRQLLKTCNYWVTVYNNRPTQDHRYYRDSACRAFSEAERRLLNPTAPLAAHTRTLKECIKPENTMDNEVQECLEGKRYPSWNSP